MRWVEILSERIGTRIIFIIITLQHCLAVKKSMVHLHDLIRLLFLVDRALKRLGVPSTWVDRAVVRLGVPSTWVDRAVVKLGVPSASPCPGLGIGISGGVKA